MPDGPMTLSGESKPPGLSLTKLEKGQPDSIGAMVRDVLFRGREYAIYRSDRGVYVHFSDNDQIGDAQRSAYVKLSVQICELRYLTSQMEAGALGRIIGRWIGKQSLYQHNMAQALMLVMESVAQRAGGLASEADATEQRAKDIAQRALDMAVRRNTVDNTIRYVRTCVFFGIMCLFAALGFYLKWGSNEHAGFYILASATGIVGAVFSVIVRAQAFELRPCDDSGLNKLMSMIRVGIGGIAGPVLALLLTTVAANALGAGAEMGKQASMATVGFLQTVAIVGLIGGFAERLVPNLVRGAADKMEARAGTPGQAAQAPKTGQPNAGVQT